MGNSIAFFLFGKAAVSSAVRKPSADIMHKNIYRNLVIIYKL